MQEVKLSRVLDASRTSRSAKQARANLARLHSEMRAMAARHEPSEKINSFQAEGRLAIQRALREAHAAERTALQAELEAERVRWEAAYMKDHQVHDFDLRNMERRLRVMTHDELQSMVTRVMSGNLKLDDPHAVDVLLLEVKARGTKVAGGEELGKRIEKNGLRNIWEQGDVGADLVRQIKLCDDVSGSGIMAVDSQNRWFAESLNSLWEMELEREEPANV